MERDTLPKLLVDNARKHGNKKVAMRRKDFGIWNCYSWEDYYNQVKYLCLGLISLGLVRGDRVALIGDNAPELYWAELATQGNGGIVTSIYSDSDSQEIGYILQYTGARFLFAEDQEQVDKVLEVVDELPLLEKVIYWDSRGLQGYHHPTLMGFEHVIGLGKQYDKNHPGLFDELVEKGSKNDPAIIYLTSGTTGLPKGATHTHGSLIAINTSLFQIDAWESDFDYVSMAPPAWMAEQAFGVVPQLLTGMCVNFPEEPETLQENIREIAPHVVLYGPRQLESIVSQVELKILDTHPIKRFAYQRLLPVGYKVSNLALSKQKVPVPWKMLYGIANLLVFRPIRDRFGLARIKWAYAGGTLMNPDIVSFFLAIGVNLKTMYGLSESGMSTHPADGDIKLHTVGVPLPGYELRISEKGEILIRSNCIFQGYWERIEATKEKLIDGWLHSGDAGYFDDDGHLIILDRVSELLDFAGGERFSPQYIEVGLRFSPFIKDVMAIGGKDRPYVICIINMDFDGVSRWAEKHHVPFTTFPDLSQKVQVYDLMQKEVERVNRIIPPFARIRKYLLLHKEFDSDEGELTRSRKLRRGAVESKYRFVIDAMYEDKDEVVAEAEVRYRDGRTGKVVTPVKIRSLDKVGIQ